VSRLSGGDKCMRCQNSSYAHATIHVYKKCDELHFQACLYLLDLETDLQIGLSSPSPGEFVKTFN
jgi:hypothetical protein